MGVSRNIYLGPYLEVRAHLNDGRVDRCKNKGACPNPDPDDCQFCPKCGIDLHEIRNFGEGSRTEGRYTYYKRVDYEGVISSVEGYDRTSFSSDGPSEIEGDEILFFLQLNDSLFDISTRENTVTDMSKFNIVATMAGFQMTHKAVIEALENAFVSVDVRYGIIYSISC